MKFKLFFTGTVAVSTIQFDSFFSIPTSSHVFTDHTNLETAIKSKN